MPYENGTIDEHGCNIQMSMQKNMRIKKDMGESSKTNSSSSGYLIIVQNYMYVSVLFILTLILLGQIWECLVKYANEPTYLETTVTQQQKALVPAMTICPQNEGYNEEHLKVEIHSYHYKM